MTPYRYVSFKIEKCIYEYCKIFIVGFSYEIIKLFN